MHLQVKFLRVLEDHKIRRLGSNKEIEIDIRLSDQSEYQRVD